MAFCTCFASLVVAVASAFCLVGVLACVQSNRVRSSVQSRHGTLQLFSQSSPSFACAPAPTSVAIFWFSDDPWTRNEPLMTPVVQKVPRQESTHGMINAASF
jgi:hypothetical protein